MSLQTANPLETLPLAAPSVPSGNWRSLPGAPR
jgi:hypothetical protein